MKNKHTDSSTYKGIFPEIWVVMDDPNLRNNSRTTGHLVAVNLSGLGQDTPSYRHRWKQPHALFQTIFDILQRLQVFTEGAQRHRSIPSQPVCEFSRLNAVFLVKDVVHFFPADLLVLRVQGKVVQGPGQSTGCGVVALKHKGVHLCPDLHVSQAHTRLVLKEKTTLELQLPLNWQTHFCFQENIDEV